ncbi:GNAT family N-acetyltransferase [Shewanella gelidimarina]|uniref:GNAT family N-acetyltransferase n=1 Tax=Shewanella gelidimarina TaxID=56813 RepID=UPI00200F43E3|nr:GNAT family N-acetyltransferase [Shewanella gelidimarina]MCL1059794.1 GNAT family N-acetyltransferase [Shewanella gelidimarina]
MLELYTDRLRLRTVIASDWDDFLYTNSCEILNQYVRIPQSESVIRQKFERVLTPNNLKEDQQLSLVIEAVHSKSFIGFLSLHNVSQTLGQLEVGYMLHDNAQGKGYATEALQGLIDWACIALMPHKFIAHCADLNIASTKVLEKCHFLQEGLLRHNWKVGDEWLDERFYGLLVAERV